MVELLGGLMERYLGTRLEMLMVRLLVSDWET